MPRPPPFSAIPVPHADAGSLYESCMRMKEVIEQITGDRPGIRMAGIFVQDTMPDPDRDGRLWLCTHATDMSLNIAVSGKWLKVGTLT